MHTSSIQTVLLALGGQYVAPMGRAVRLHLAQGKMEVVGRWQWLAETAWQSRHSLREGEYLRLAGDEALTLTACTPCVVLLIFEDGLSSQMRGRWRSLFRH